MICNSIKILRKNKKLTQKELASLIGVKEYTIGDWERNRGEPNTEILKKLCIVFDVTADELLEIDTEEERNKILIQIEHLTNHGTINNNCKITINN